MMLQACLNGGRGKDFHPAMPCSPDELAADASRAVAAGAAELHIHPRDAAGIETLEPDLVAAALTAVRTMVPGIPVGLSTHWDIPPGGIARRLPISRWRVLPDYVSINLVEQDAPQLIVEMLGKGVGVEAGLWSAADAERFAHLPDARRCLRVLIEINEQDAVEGLAVAAGIRQVLADHGIALPQLLHGLDATVWPLHEEALRLGLDSRIGLEDGRDLPSGAMSAGNAELIAAAVAMRATSS
ncbi:3-keto-5-aminohexanoate cleavage protein [Starkeya sp. ORNL1]|uniref:3-keto-5-aminohexanoate cleavage protein n=1 Tax=Starkeya sp. ORNL1 TaxID=2709380 RepID=UPI001FEF89FB|nr:3-keto-5-aminohexanoate cleavage protein [Starkeya sp. ORNL1]